MCERRGSVSGTAPDLSCVKPFLPKLDSIGYLCRVLHDSLINHGVGPFPFAEPL